MEINEVHNQTGLAANAPIPQAESLFQMIGATRQVDVDTSETSSYQSSSENEAMDESVVNKQKPPKQKQRVRDIDDLYEEGDEGSSTYNKFKTQHEIEIGEAYKTGPTRLVLDDLDEIIEFGQIVQYIQQGCGMVLVSPNDPQKLLDIENVVVLKDKRVIGFVYEPVGPITQPLYSIQLYPEFVDELTSSAGFTSMRESLHGQDLFLVKRTLRLINNKIDQILKMKGCDASNMFDEELPPEEQEHSDDEYEREQKKLNKLRRLGKLEEGEIPSTQFAGKKRLNNDKNSNQLKNVRPSQYRGAEMPSYSTNMSAVHA